jgi:hypothetical protein
MKEFKNGCVLVIFMPVNNLDFSNDNVGQFNRLSASQVITYDGCPRQWFYEKVYKFQIPQFPVMYVGKAVEEAFCRVLMESPFLIPSGAHRETLQPTPLGDDGRPSLDAHLMFPAQHLIPLPEHEVPQTFEELKKWAYRRVDAHFDSCLLRQKQEWEKHLRKAGDWSDVDPEACKTMVLNAIEFHFEEIQQCIHEINDTELEEWRAGTRYKVPSPDGYGVRFPMNKNPFAGVGQISIAEAWELARPWFVDPHAQDFAMNAVHPDFWFQGEYDLVYRWGNRIKIVDLKASDGTSFRSEGYEQQLQMYAMLWWTTHEKAQTVDGLEIWYVGHPSKKIIDVPTIEQLSEIESRLKALFEELKLTTPSLNDCRPEPKSIHTFSPGGKVVEDSLGSRCDQCSWSTICPGSRGSEPNIPNEIQLAGTNHSLDIIPLGETVVRLNLKCRVFSVMQRPAPSLPAVRIVQSQAFAQFETRSIKPDDPRIEAFEKLSKDQEIFIENAIVQSTFKGEILIKFDPWTLIHFDDRGLEYSTILGHRTRWNVGGVVAYTFSKQGIGAGGKPWLRKGVVLFDSSGCIHIDGWENQWGPQYDMLEPGDTVVFSNLSLDAWASQLRGDIQHNTSFRRI